MRFLLLLLGSAASVPDKLFGIPPSRLEYYKETNGNFKCFDGTLVPYDALNDDYCDCPDGSDEPGTSACPQGLFYCKNEGHQPALIHKNRVNDGICDEECCDGSDEWQKNVECPNVCAEIAHEIKKKLEEQRKKQIEGYNTRHLLIKEAKKIREERQVEIDDLARHIINAEKKLKDLDIIQREADEYTKRLEERKAVFTKADDMRKCPHRLIKYRFALEDLKNKYRTVETRMFDARNNADQLAAIADAPDFVEKLDYHRDVLRNIANELKRLTQIDRESLEFDLEPGVDDIPLGPCEDPSDTLSNCLEHVWNSTRSFLETSWSNQLWTKVGDTVRRWWIPKGWEEEALDMRKHPFKAKIKWHDVDNDRKFKQERLDVLKFQQYGNMGPDYVFDTLVGNRSFYNGQTYKYEVVFLKEIFQRERNQESGGTSLGTFSHWGSLDPKYEPEKKGRMRDYKAMVYREGDYCVDDKYRESEIRLECGSVNEILEVTEPVKCQHLIRMTTPAVCDSMPSEETPVYVRDEL